MSLVLLVDLQKNSSNVFFCRFSTFFSVRWHPHYKGSCTIWLQLWRTKYLLSHVHPPFCMKVFPCRDDIWLVTSHLPHYYTTCFTSDCQGSTTGQMLLSETKKLFQNKCLILVNSINIAQNLTIYSFIVYVSGQSCNKILSLYWLFSCHCFLSIIWHSL